jgi:hypothetical protein
VYFFLKIIEGYSARRWWFAICLKFKISFLLFCFLADKIKSSGACSYYAGFLYMSLVACCEGIFAVFMFCQRCF